MVYNIKFQQSSTEEPFPGIETQTFEHSILT